MVRLKDFVLFSTVVNIFVGKCFSRILDSPYATFPRVKLLGKDYEFFIVS